MENDLQPDKSLKRNIPLLKTLPNPHPHRLMID